MLLIILTKKVTDVPFIETSVTQWIMWIFEISVFPIPADGASAIPQPPARCADLWR